MNQYTTIRWWSNFPTLLPFPCYYLFVHLVPATVFIMSAPYINKMWVASNSTHTWGTSITSLSLSLLPASNPTTLKVMLTPPPPPPRLQWNICGVPLTTTHHISSRPEITSKYHVLCLLQCFKFWFSCIIP